MNHIALWTTSSIPPGIAITIPREQQHIVWGDLNLFGRLTIQSGGTLVIIKGQIIENPGSLFVNNGTLIEFQCASQGDLDELAQTLGGNLTTVEGRVDAVEGRVDAVEGRVDAVEGRVDAVEGRVDAVEGRVDVVEGDLSSEVARLESLINQSDVYAWTQYVRDWGRN